MRIASLVALFVFMGGAAGGVVTVTLLFIWSLITALSGSYFDAAWIGQFLISLPIGVVFGIVLGFPAALATSSVYALSPRTRHATTIAPIGAIFSAIEGAILPSILGLASDAAVSATFAGVFAVSGAAASVACHTYEKRWGE